MSKYRFRTEEEFKRDNDWNHKSNTPKGWNSNMVQHLGDHVDAKFNLYIEDGSGFKGVDGWWYNSTDCVLNKEEMPIEQILEQIKLNNSLIKKEKQMNNLENVTEKATEKFVFMDKTVQVLNIGFNTCKNIVLYGPGE